MICKGCGANYDSNKVMCPYCGQINEEGLSKANEVKIYQKKLESTEKEVLETGSTLVLKKITIRTCAILGIIMVLFGGLTFYYEHREEWQKQSQVSGSKYTANLAQINTYIASKDYVRAYTLAYATAPDNYDFTDYPTVQEELVMIGKYVDFTRDIRSYFTNDRDLSYLDTDSFIFSYAKDIYDARATSAQAQTVKEDLCANLDLYLKYMYQLTDEEIQSLKTVPDFDDYTIEGTTHYEGILTERIRKYEEEHTK